MRIVPLAALLLPLAASFVSAGSNEDKFAAKAQSLFESLKEPLRPGMSGDTVNSFNAKLGKILEPLACGLTGGEVKCPPEPASNDAADQRIEEQFASAQDSLSELASDWKDALKDAAAVVKQEKTLASQLDATAQAIAKVPTQTDLAAFMNRLIKIAGPSCKTAQTNPPEYDCSKANPSAVQPALDAVAALSTDVKSSISTGQKDAVSLAQQLATLLGAVTQLPTGLTQRQMLTQSLTTAASAAGCKSQGAQFDCSGAAAAKVTSALAQLGVLGTELKDAQAQAAALTQKQAQLVAQLGPLNAAINALPPQYANGLPAVLQHVLTAARCTQTGQSFACANATPDSVNAGLDQAATLSASVQAAQQKVAAAAKALQNVAGQLSPLIAVIADTGGSQAGLTARFSALLQKIGCSQKGQTVDCSKGNNAQVSPADVNKLISDADSAKFAYDQAKPFLQKLSTDLSYLAASIPKIPTSEVADANSRLKQWASQAGCTITGQTVSCANSSVAGGLLNEDSTVEQYLVGITWTRSDTQRPKYVARQDLTVEFSNVMKRLAAVKLTQAMQAYYSGLIYNLATNAGCSNANYPKPGGAYQCGTSATAPTTLDKIKTAVNPLSGVATTANPPPNPQTDEIIVASTWLSLTQLETQIQQAGGAN